MRSLLKAVLVSATTAGLLLTPSALAAPMAEHQALAGPGGFSLGYLTPEITISKGDSISFSNYDIFNHDFVHDVESDGFGGPRNVPWCKPEKGKKGDHGAHAHGCPVFWSRLIAANNTTAVKGLKRVKPGQTYTFFCTIHHNMKGTLTVEK